MRLRTALLIGTGAVVVIGGTLAIAWRARPEQRPSVVVVTIGADGTPSRIESDVTAPLEAALSVLPGLSRMRSESRDGGASIACTFAGTPDLEATARVRAAVEGARPHLPPDAQLPTVSHASGGGAPLWVVGDLELRRELLAVPGVVSVETCGERRERVHVVLDLARLSARGAEIGDIVHALREAFPTTVLLGGRATPEPSEIDRVALPARGAEARIADVAVVERRDEETGCSAILDREGEPERAPGRAMLLGVLPRVDIPRAGVIESALARVRARGARHLDPARTLSVGFVLPRPGDAAERRQAARALVDRARAIDGGRSMSDVMAVVRPDGAGELLMTVEPSKETDARATSRDALRALPGVAYGGVTASPRGKVPARLVVTVRGPELDALAARARELRPKIVSVAGVGPAVGRDEVGRVPEMTATLDRAAIAAAGASASAVAEAVQVVLHGVSAGPVFVTTGAHDPRLLEVATIAGRPLASFARVVLGAQPGAIVHVDRERALELRWEVERDVRRDVSRAIADPSVSLELESAR